MVSDDPDQFDRSLAVLAAARFAALPISAFSRIAVERMFERPANVSQGGSRSSGDRRPVYELLTDAVASSAKQTQIDAVVRLHFEVVATSFASTLFESTPAQAIGEATEETSDAWQPDDPLVAQRDRILRFEGAEPMTAMDIGRFLRVSRTTLVTRRRSGAVLGLPLGSARKLVYPRWQFDPARPTHLVPGLQRVLSLLSMKDPWGVADLLTSRHPALDGETPIDRLRATRGAEADRIAALVASEYLGGLEATMPKQPPKQIYVVQRPGGWGAVRPEQSARVSRSGRN